MKCLCWAVVLLACGVLRAGEARFVANLKDGKAQTVVCYGTSLTAQSHEWVDGLRAELDARWPGKATVVNAGLSGKNSATGLANVQAQVVAKNPDAVLIEFSMNDAADTLNAGKTSAEALAAAEENLKAIIAAIRTAKPGCEIILETMDPYLKVAGTGLSNRTDLDRHVAMYRRVAAEEGYLIIDTYPIWSRILAKGADEYKRLVPDGVHPNALGSRTVTLPNVLRTLGIGTAESAREIPVIRDVDVLVVGGTFAAVSAAVAARKAGATAYLVAPRQNLAEEIVLPRRLLRDPADEPLADLESGGTATVGRKVAFTYTTAAATDSQKRDDSFTKLTDGKRESAGSQSVQYGDESVTWTLTTSGDAEPVHDVALLYYYRSGDFDVELIALETSADGSSYTAAKGVVTRETVATVEYGDECRALKLTLAEPTSVRHLRLTATRAAGMKRMLVGEIELRVEGVTSVRPLAPLVYEKALDRRLADAGVAFFTGAQACDVVRDAAGAVSGVVFADRSGRQAVRAKVVVDATDKGVVARKVATLRPIAAETTVDFTQTVVAKAGLGLAPAGYAVATGAATSDTIKLDTGNDSSMIPKDAETSYPASTYVFTKSFPLTSGDWLVVNAIVQEIKTATWTKSAADVSEVPFYVTPERIVGETAVETWTDASSVPLGAFRPKGVAGLYVVGQASDLSRALAVKLSLPGVETVLGTRVGVTAAAEAAARAPTGGLSTGAASGSAATTVVRERLDRPLGIGADKKGAVVSKGGELPVLARADIAILGLGTAGVPAAITALGKGRTVVGIDFLHSAGGVMTEGRIGKYYRGCNRGFTKNIVDPGTLSTGWVFSMAKAEWMRRALAADARATTIYGAQVAGVLTDGEDAQGRKVVKGLVVVLPDGTRGVVKADVVLDCSGNAEVAHMAGCRTQFLEPSELLMQGAGTAYHVLGSSYFNTDYTFPNTSDAGDLSNLARRARTGAKAGRYNVGDPSVGSRERRRIVGDVVVNERDILRRRKWSDTIMHGTSDYDMHGYSSSDALMYRERAHGTQFSAELPYRALVPAELEGVLATGLGISATRDAMPIIRMQRDVQNQGHAAGLAASMALATGSVRTIDVRALQQELVTDGTLDKGVLTDTDEAVSDAALAEAVANLAADKFVGIEKVLERPADAKPLLAAAYGAAADDAHRLACAIALVLVGDNSHLGDILAAVKTADWTKGFDFRGLGNYGRQTAPVDYLVHTLARSGDRAAVESALTELAAKLGPSAKLSHFRMLTRAADELKAPALRAALARVVADQAALSGHAAADVADVPAHDKDGKDNATDDAERTKCLIELSLARALHNAGNEVGTAILTAYLDDVRTIYAEYAALLLAGKGEEPKPVVTERIAVSNATLSVTSSALSLDEPVECVADGSFEPVKTPLTTTDRNQQDRRSVSGATWLAENIPTWTFGPDDNNGSGVCNNGSYFTNNGQLQALSAENAHCAFLRIDPTKSPVAGPGRISRKFVSPVSNAPFTFSCRLAERYWDGKAWTGRVALEIDGKTVATSALVDKWSEWATFEVGFTVERPGEHTLALVAVANGEGVCDVLVDDVRLGCAFRRPLTASAPLAGVTVDLAADAKLDLDASVAGTMGGLRYGGRRILGLVSAATCPAFVTGEGWVRTYGNFLLTIQ